MSVLQNELTHLIFLAEVVIASRKKEVMEDTLQCLLYIIKSLPEVEVPDSVAEQIAHLTERIEEKLRQENERIQEIQGNLGRLAKPNSIA
ncbi:MULTISPECIES: hypothetical protein [Paenibacillus]|uniref:hypothetical protein n=1 Tax=Paenibacillus TaxID=44249 RepID=UPI00020D776E|nr:MULTISPECIES: hypothetical protein [Paenibacillus]EGL16797.1 hypothetical protein HMPREF9413_5021 [Paenibacillus sp. HGF7]EPD82427.1 hypothetical protein HMPREF1207_04254 [Paenibacillus sp. HGH0039]MBV6714363.1 hypothetical protein [Paenibacillus chitinolyticus]GKS09025.1 hypothetical protein YDYSY3_00250 [Paenibacillus chitinolyticus]